MRAVDTRWRLLLLGAAVLSMLNMAAGVWLSIQPERSLDLQQVADWAGAWTAGVNPYASPATAVDYPPWALVVLAPLSSIAPAWRPALWVVVNLGLLIWLVTTLVRQTREPSRPQVILALLLGATACSRTLNQFSLPSYALAIAGAPARWRRHGSSAASASDCR